MRRGRGLGVRLGLVMGLEERQYFLDHLLGGEPARVEQLLMVFGY
jgi:hypothetical protein